MLSFTVGELCKIAGRAGAMCDCCLCATLLFASFADELLGERIAFRFLPACVEDTSKSNALKPNATPIKISVYFFEMEVKLKPDLVVEYLANIWDSFRKR